MNTSSLRPSELSVRDPSYVPGPRQLEILTFVADGEWFETSTRSEQNSCVRMLDHGFLIRDPNNSYRFTASAAGAAYVARLLS